jgi:hypothetical protein
MSNYFLKYISSRMWHDKKINFKYMKNKQGNEFLIFWIHIVYEGHIYLCNVL